MSPQIQEKHRETGNSTERKHIIEKEKSVGEERMNLRLNQTKHTLVISDRNIYCCCNELLGGNFVRNSALCRSDSECYLEEVDVIVCV